LTARAGREKRNRREEDHKNTAYSVQKTAPRTKERDNRPHRQQKNSNRKGKKKNNESQPKRKKTREKGGKSQ